MKRRTKKEIAVSTALRSFADKMIRLADDPQNDRPVSLADALRLFAKWARDEAENPLVAR